MTLCVCARVEVAYMVVHIGSTGQRHPDVVGPLVRVHCLTVGLDSDSVVDMVVVADQLHFPHPVVRLCAEFRVGRVSSVAGKSRTELEETTIRDCVLVAVSIGSEENLPSQTATTCVIVDFLFETYSHVVENRL